MAAPQRTYTAAEVIEEIFRDQDSGDEDFKPAGFELREVDANDPDFDVEEAFGDWSSESE